MNFQELDTWVDQEAFQKDMYKYDGSILGSPDFFKIRELPESFVMATLSMNSQTESILAGNTSVYQGMCHQTSATVLRKLLEQQLITDGQIYTGNDKKVRYKNHSLLIVDLHNGTQGLIDLALDVDIVVPIDGNWHESHLLKSPRKYKANINEQTQELEFIIDIPEKEKSLEYKMLPTSDERYKKSLEYSLALSQKGMVQSLRTSTDQGFELSIEFITDFPEIVNRVLDAKKPLEIEFMYDIIY